MEPSESFSHQPFLPDETIIEILSRLPVKTLLGFRPVCRFWRQLISSDPHFISSQLQNSRRYGSGIIKNALLDHRNFLPPPCICQGGPHDDQVQEFTKDFSAHAGEDHRWRVIFRGGAFTFAGYCNGLICFYKFCDYNTDIHIYLWNPALNQCRVLPESSYNGKNLSFHSIIVCLLYNAIANDYQVVKIFYLKQSGFYKAEIYSLGTNSWKPLISEFFPHKEEHLFYSRCEAVVHNGFPHWLAHCENLALCVLDLKQEKIREISLPEEVYKREDSRLELFQGCLSIFCGLTKARGNFELWVMKEQGQEISWINKIVVPGNMGIRLLHHRTTEVTGNLFATMMKRTTDGWRKCLVSYDLEKERAAEELSRDDLDLGFPNYFYYVFDYAPSLISLASVI